MNLDVCVTHIQVSGAAVLSTLPYLWAGEKMHTALNYIGKQYDL